MVEPQPDVVDGDTSASDTATTDTASAQDASFSGCVQLGCDGSARACVYSLADEDGTCRDTITSCNEAVFPFVCDCMYDTVGDSVEGHALCPNGVRDCDVRGGRLYVTCNSN